MCAIGAIGANDAAAERSSDEPHGVIDAPPITLDTPDTVLGAPAAASETSDGDDGSVRPPSRGPSPVAADVRREGEMPDAAVDTPRATLDAADVAADARPKRDLATAGSAAPRPASRLLAAIACGGVAVLAWQWWARPALHTGGDGPSPIAPLWPDMRLNLNSATIAEFTALPEIGEATAIRIIEDREAHGPFTSVDDLDRVPGIGARTLERLRDFVVAE